MSKVTYEDLDRAVQWLEGYEAAPDEDATGMWRVADMLKKEMARRDNEAAARTVAKVHGVSVQKARKALRAAQSN